MKHFLDFTIRWIANNLSIPFWTIGHIVLTLNIYDDIVELTS